jgi:hypothetical protein
MGMSNTRDAVARSKPYILIVVFSLVAIFAQTFIHKFEEERWYRDLVGISAAKDIEVQRAEIVDDGKSIVVAGVLTKVHCEKLKGSDAAYTQDINGVWHPAVFDPSAEFPETPFNRPHNDAPEAFGPWKITSLVTNPQRARFWVSHKFCPEKTIPLLVFDIPWADLNVNKENDDG